MHCECQARRHQPSRRSFIAAAALAPAMAPLLRRPARAAAAAAQIGGEEARRRLVAGNARFVAGRSLRLDHSARREAVAPAQMPFAIVLGCSDSRAPPEVVFDQGLGDIFTIRVAGNVADEVGIGSIEYAVEHFATPLIVVLGHERCGAVGATVEAVRSGTMPEPHVASIVAAIRPAVEASRNEAGDPVENAVRANVAAVVRALESSGPVLQPAVAAGRLKIVGAEYGLATGRVAFLG